MIKEHLHLLSTKLYSPRPRVGLAPRERLWQRLEDGLGQGAFLLIPAPAGFGKSSPLGAMNGEDDGHALA
ncbi:MAG: hypothetical protein JW850_00570 [Thermoflexales bacterium]|nr:hypothetical protein [Thermoflexales bacterium]